MNTDHSGYRFISCADHGSPHPKIRTLQEVRIFICRRALPSVGSFVGGVTPRPFHARPFAASSRGIEGIFDLSRHKCRRALPAVGSFVGGVAPRPFHARPFAASSRGIEGIFDSFAAPKKAGAKTPAFFGAVDRNRTDTGSPPTDFESVASASFTTTAQKEDET